MNDKPTNEKRVVINLPTLFTSYPGADQDLVLNPQYHTVRSKRVSAIAEYCNFDAKMTKTVDRCNFAYFIAICAPKAPVAKFEVLLDWGNFVFPFDDRLDNGDLRDDVLGATKLTRSLMSAMEIDVASAHFDAGRKQGLSTYTQSLVSAMSIAQAGIHDKNSEQTSELQDFATAIAVVASVGPCEEKEAIVSWHDTIWDRIRHGSSISTQRRFVKAMGDYCSGAVKHTNEEANGRTVSAEEMLASRKLSAGVSPLFALIEYAHGIQLPDEVFQNGTIQELEDLAIEFVVLVNDILSYRKEESEKVVHNLVASYRKEGLSAQEAMDAVGVMLQSCFKRWELAMDALPSWGEPIDGHVRLYVEGLSNVVKANLEWSFFSGRYLGKGGQKVRETEQLDVLEFPDYL